ncbi:mitochondral 37S ribosomal protein S27 [Tilletia horrida]|uniref:Small ribosomal subunit protein mS33 n=1 Tax=Tilletia horrida TaxID=155126 RepID=A0AAN6G7D5_9BASI|nr:mitochondral 37S ribosomal protein S27 [Tilletia horrida]
MSRILPSRAGRILTAEQAGPSLARTVASSSTVAAAAAAAAATASSSSRPAPPAASSSSLPSSSTTKKTSTRIPGLPPYATTAQPHPARSLSPLSRPPARTALQALRDLRTTLFEQTHNPLRARTGAKFLRAPLVGPRITQYYPPQLSLGEVRRFLLDPARLQELDEQDRVGAYMVSRRMVLSPYEVQRLEDVARRKALGKGPPKKGEGRRAAMKNKSGKK